MNPRYNLLLLLFLLSSFYLMSCSDNDTAELRQMRQNKATIPMILKATPPTYDDTNTRSYATEWPDSAHLYFKFITDGEPVSGRSTYTAATDEWTLTLTGSLPEVDSDTECEVWYFEGASSENESFVKLSATTAVYHDSHAKYFYSDGRLSVTTHLRPTQTRMRFSGTAGRVLKISNWPYINSFDATSWEMSTSNTSSTSITIGSDGFTPYLYGAFGIDEQWIEVDIEDEKYFRPFSDFTLGNGKSYSIASPTEEFVLPGKWSHDIMDYRSFIITGKDTTIMFKMIKVPAGKFEMGSIGDNVTISPAHMVTISRFFFMGETEVTNELWNAIMDTIPSRLSKDDNFPVDNISWDDCNTFIIALNEKLSLQLIEGECFRLPTEAEWEFSAKGGNHSKNYTYSGSNTIRDVAWYSTNKTQPVKTKTANELGLYDMSGNVMEWCYDWFDIYSSEAQTDPTGPASGSNRVQRGGSWSTISSTCRVTHRNKAEPNLKANNFGLRLCLGAPLEE